jgi:hypothetical protein
MLNTTMSTQVAIRLLSGSHLGLQCRCIGINPLQLGKVAIKNSHNLAQLVKYSQRV